MENKGEKEIRITWSKGLATGDEIIDEQHKKIFYITDAFLQSCLKGEENKIIEEMLDFLINYTVEHFEYEEKLMIEYKYPDFEKHKKYHDQFKITVTEFKNDFEINGSTDKLNKNLRNAVVKWLIKHIKHEDFKIAQYIRKVI